MSEILSQINTLKDCKTAQYQIQNIIEENYANLGISIQNNDIPSFHKAVEWGVEWDSELLWKVLAKKTNFLTCSQETLDFLITFKPPHISIPKKDYYSASISTHDKWDDFVSSTFSVTMNNIHYSTYKFNGELLFWLHENRPHLLIDEKKKVNYIVPFMKKFLTEDISNENLKPYHNFFIQKYPDHVKYLFWYAKSENLDFLWNSPIYEDIKNKLVTKNDLKEKVMTAAVSFLKLDDIARLEKNNVTFVLSKQSLSEIFSKKIDNWSVEQLQFIENKIDNIRMHDDVILRTALNTNQKDYIPFIIEQYAYGNEIESIPKLFDGREDNEALKVAKEHIENVKIYINLEEATQKKYNSSLKRKL